MRTLLALSLAVLSASCSAGCRGQGPVGGNGKARPAAAAVFVRADIPRIDFHTHVMLGAALRAARLLEGHGIVHAVNLSGPPPGHGLDDFVADSEIAYNRFSVFTNLNWAHCKKPGYGARMAADLTRARAAGARGVKIQKALGLGVEGPDGKLLAIDDPGLDPAFERAGELGMPVAIHSGDPKAFWEPPDENNERADELRAHPEWSFYADYKKGAVPSWQALYDAFVRRVARHPRTTIVGVHFGNDPEDPAQVARLLDRYPNLMIDLAARVPEIGRRDAAHDPAAMRAFFVRYQDRILFGTDTGVGRGRDDLMFGSTGSEPPGEKDADRFFTSIWRYLETSDRDIPTPTPIQGRWNVDGVGLPREVLEKIYYKNALRLLRIELPKQPLPPIER